MSNLTKEQIRNLEKDGYKIIERGGKTDIVKETSSGTIRYKLDNGVVQQIVSYFGNVRDKDDHDRLTVDHQSGEISGHGFEHNKW